MLSAARVKSTLLAVLTEKVTGLGSSESFSSQGFCFSMGSSKAQPAIVRAAAISSM